ncbi:RluA family pseudouridine synthase [Priestia megaterium]|uniref:RluA family pseudouridine synthase n=1 Tax=Priestia megaterium TaxID=1404 RepID=UPI003CFC4EAA
MKQVFTLSWTVDNSFEGVAVREFLKEHDISKASLTDIKFRGGAIEVNGKHATVRYILQKGDEIKVAFPPEKASESLLPKAIPLDIVYEDEYILVLNKQPNMPSIPSREHLTWSLSNAVLYYYEKNNINSTVHLVNRLDRDTSGLLIVAKHRHVHYLFSKAQKEHEIKRVYRAFVHGKLVGKETIEAPIGRKESSIIEREVREDGQIAITHYTALRQYSSFTEVALSLETGRTHQIRVHMAYKGYPLLGDTLYGGTNHLISRQALHSYELTFFHPFLQKTLSFTAPLPPDMQKLQIVKESRFF